MTAGGARDTSRLFGALSHRYRRIVLYYLREHETATLDGLVDLVTGWVEAGPGPDESVDHDGARAQLHHVHLPALDSAGLVEYEQDTGSVTLLDYSAAAEAILDAAFEADTTQARLDIEEVLAAAESRSQAYPTGETACGTDGDADRGDSPEGGSEEADDA